MSMVLYLNYYATQTQFNATDFVGGSQVRGNVFKNNTLGENLNTMAFVPAQAAVVSLALALKAPQS